MVIRRYPLRHAEFVRSARPWWRSNRIHQQHTPLADRVPWVSFGAARELERRVRPGTRIFEFGAGGSTAFFLDRGASVVTAEHDEEWTQLVREAVDPGSDWTLHAVPPSPTPDPDYASHRFSGSLRDYVTTIDRYEPFDVVVVDGRARSACVRHAMARVVPGGTLVLDNSDREMYAEAAKLVDAAGWTRRDYFGPTPYNLFFTQTTIWTAPAGT